MKEYSWKTGFVGKGIKAELVGKELEIIEEEGEITPERVLNYAEKHKKSELHKCFEWDDTEAARKFRLNQAYTVLCNISIKIKEKPTKKQRVYVNVKSSLSGVKTFKSIKDVLEDDEEYKQLINRARNEFECCKEKYEDLIKRNDLKDLIFEIYKTV